MDFIWKMLVYISADNTLYNDALVSLRQLTDASLQNNVDIIVQLDGPNPDQVSRYRCAGGHKQLVWEAPDGYPADRVQRLDDFLNSTEAKPSTDQRVFLDLWGHGAGLDHFFLYKEAPALKTAIAKISPIPTVDDPNRYVQNIQLASKLSGFVARMNSEKIDPKQIASERINSKQDIRKIDLLGLDSCLMGMAEICHELSDSVSFMVASDEEVPVGSWPYDSIVDDLNKFPGMDASTLSAVIINRFVENYSRKGHKTRVSLSSMNLSSSNELVTEMKGLVDALNAASKPGVDKDGTARQMIFRARDASRTPDEVTYIDFVVFCEELAESFPENQAVSDAAKKVLDVLVKSSYILYHRDAREDGSIDAHGLAIYFPETLDSIASQINETLKPLVLMPRNDVKFAGSTTKFAGSTTKSADGPQITGYEILWGNYQELLFNKETGWADLIYQLLEGPNGSTGQTNPPSPAQSLQEQECVHA